MTPIPHFRQDFSYAIIAEPALLSTTIVLQINPSRYKDIKVEKREDARQVGRGEQSRRIEKVREKRRERS